MDSVLLTLKMLNVIICLNIKMLKDDVCFNISKISVNTNVKK